MTCQALRTYREVLRDPEFGELLAGGADPERYDCLFATIDSITSRDLLTRLGVAHWHTVVVDECHRLAADRLHAFVTQLRPQTLLTVDLYNDGVDLPSVDALLLLRPTQSPVLFQQQIGRALRLALGKENCLVLDFVGQHRADFRFDRLLSSLTGWSRRELLSGVEQGFDSLPPGCHIHLRPKTREQVLQGLRALMAQNWRRMKTELQAYVALRGRTSVSLAGFLQDQAQPFAAPVGALFCLWFANRLARRFERRAWIEPSLYARRAGSSWSRAEGARQRVDSRFVAVHFHPQPTSPAP